MHKGHQSFAERQRMLDHDGDASNQVIWFADAPLQSDLTPQAFEVIDQWMANIRRHPKRGVARNKPELATDRCFTAQGEEIARGLYGDWAPSAAERARLAQIFPSGVCDYTAVAAAGPSDASGPERRRPPAQRPGEGRGRRPD